MDAATGMPGRDPGWGVVWRRMWPGILLPFVLTPFVLRRAVRKGIDALSMTRATFLAWAAAHFWILLVLYQVMAGGTEEARVAPGLFAAGVCLHGVISFVLIGWAARKPLDVSSPETLVGSYQTTFFLELAMAQAVFLTGFVGTFVTSEYWLALVGFPFSAIGFAVAAPTAGNLRRLQAKIHAQGSSLDLTRELTSRPAEMRQRPGPR